MHQSLVPEAVRKVIAADEQQHGMQTGTSTTEFLHLANPQNYKYLPAKYAVFIPEAGLPKEKVFDTEKERVNWYKKKDAPN